METGARAAAPGVAEPRPTCTCDKKPCGCQKADVNYAFLHSTGNGAPGARCFSKTNEKKTAVRSGNCLRPRCAEAWGGPAMSSDARRSSTPSAPAPAGRKITQTTKNPEKKTQGSKIPNTGACSVFFLRSTDSVDVFIEDPPM